MDFSFAYALLRNVDSAAFTINLHEFLHEMLNDGCRRGCAQLAFKLFLGRGNASRKNCCSRRCGNVHQAVRALDLSATGLHRRRDDTIGMQVAHGAADEQRVQNRLAVADLVEMRLVDRAAVDLRLGGSQDPGYGLACTAVAPRRPSARQSPERDHSPVFRTQEFR